MGRTGSTSLRCSNSGHILLTELEGVIGIMEQGTQTYLFIRTNCEDTIGDSENPSESDRGIALPVGGARPPATLRQS